MIKKHARNDRGKILSRGSRGVGGGVGEFPLDFYVPFEGPRRIMYGSLLLKPIHKGSPLERSSSTPPKPSGGLTPLSSSFSHKPRGGG